MERPDLRITRPSESLLSASSHRSRVSEAAAQEHDATNVEVAHGAQGLAPAFPLNTAGVSLKMPSAQAAKLTKAYNQLIRMKEAGSVEAVVLEQVEQVQKELDQLRMQCEEVRAVNPEQEEFKKVWMQKYMHSKEQFLNRWRTVQEMEDSEPDERSERRSGSCKSRRTQWSTTSSIRKAVAKAEEEQAKLELKLRQLEEEQAQRRQLQERRRREQLRRETEDEHIREQRERQEIEQQLQGVRVRRAALSRAASEASNRGERSSREELERLPPVRRPVEAWLRDNTEPSCGAERRRVEPRGGFVSVMTPPPQQQMTAQDQLLQHVLLAQAKLPTFKGDPLEFLWFQRAFEAQVSSVTRDPARRLYLLLQQLQGQPHDLVKGCQLMEPSEGYDRAMEKLQRRYGHPVRQAMAFRNRLLAWPSVKTTMELEAFNVQLQLCQDVKVAGHGLAELDSPATLLQLASKLVNKLQLGWQTKAFDIEEKQQREANFADFASFIERQAGLRSHPVYSKLGPERDSKRTVKVAATAKEETAEGRDRSSELTTVTTAATAAIKGAERPRAVEKPPKLTAHTASKGPEGAEVDTVVPDAFKAPCLLCHNTHPTANCRSNELSKKERCERLRGLCFGCLRPGHLARHCESRSTCQRCGKNHPTVMHVDRPNPKSSASSTTASKSEKQASKAETTSSAMGTEMTLATKESESYAVATLPVKVWYKSRCVIVNAVLDPASTASFVSDDLVRELALTPQTTSIGVTTLNKQDDMAVGMVQGLKVGNIEGNHEFVMPLAYAVQALPFKRVTTQQDVERWRHLQNVPFQWAPEAPISMLIGLNIAGALRPERVVLGAMHEPYAVRTPLGWAVHGQVRKNDRPTEGASVLWTQTTENLVLKRLDKLHQADFANAYDFSEKGPSQDDVEWEALVNASVQRVPLEQKAVGHDHNRYQYQIGLPFREGAVSRLQNNAEQALQRMRALERRFRSNHQFRQDYTAFMKKMIDNGYVEQVATDEDKSTDDHPVSYIPHHGVYHPKKPGKIRVVFNCANKFHGVALNDCLLQGPDLTNSLLGVLLRFRQYPIAFMADIESMFYRVKVPAEQRDTLRFLWWAGEGGQLATFRMKVHLFGATSSPSVANFALRRSAKDAFEAGRVSKSVQEAVNRNFYVDDCLKSVQTEKEAIEVAKGLVKACAYGGFRLTKFVSTSDNLLKALPTTEWARGPKEMIDLNNDKADPLGSVQERALGVTWSLREDCFRIKVTKGSEQCSHVSKRKVLSHLSAVYDPMGIAAPVIIVARILFREITKGNLQWDEDIGEVWRQRWMLWVSGLNSLQELVVPRCLIRKSPPAGLQLHVFCDASTEAYAAVVYLRQEGSQLREAEVDFILGKARVSPPRMVTVPRLELTAAKLATEVAGTVLREMELPIEKKVFWSDSTTVLKYLRNRSRRFHVFVANRICSILSASSVEEWRYVPTLENPADEATRGRSGLELGQGSWLKGPRFLQCNEEMWPIDPETAPLVDNDPELHRTEATAFTDVEVKSTFIELIASKHSSVHKVRRIVAAWLRVKAWLKAKRKEALPKRPFSVPELREADVAAIAYLQHVVWPEEVATLRRGESVPRKSALYKLSPVFKSNGNVVVMQSRVREELIIVPKSAYAELLVQNAHEQQGHQGRAVTAAAAQRKHWIVGLMQFARRVVKCCPSCQLRKSQPSVTVMAPLPAHRCHPTSCRPFQVTGVDYFGPFYVKRARSRVKAYGVIFTCGLTRAVHLEVSEDLSSESFINALRRFIARRGHVQKFVSDNGTNFVGAQTLLKSELAKEVAKLKLKEGNKVAAYLQRQDIQWTFNPPCASHHGGFWERLIRSIRRILEALMTKHVLTYEALVTMMCEAEAIMNNRPLTAVSDDPEDMEALTPNHLLIGRSDGTDLSPPGDYECTAGALRHRWKQVQHVTNEFWKRWHQEYRVLLHQRPKWHQPIARGLQLHDPVLVLDPLVPRDQWKLGRVIKVHRNDMDGEVRVVDVKTKQGVLTRPITKLCLLETASENPS